MNLNVTVPHAAVLTRDLTEITSLESLQTYFELLLELGHRRAPG